MERPRHVVGLLELTVAEPVRGRLPRVLDRVVLEHRVAEVAAGVVAPVRERELDRVALVGPGQVHGGVSQAVADTDARKRYVEEGVVVNRGGLVRIRHRRQQRCSAHRQRHVFEEHEVDLVHQIHGVLLLEQPTSALLVRCFQVPSHEIRGSQDDLRQNGQRDPDCGERLRRSLQRKSISLRVGDLPSDLDHCVDRAGQLRRQDGGKLKQVPVFEVRKVDDRVQHRVLVPRRVVQGGVFWRSVVDNLPVDVLAQGLRGHGEAREHRSKVPAQHPVRHALQKRRVRRRPQPRPLRQRHRHVDKVHGLCVPDVARVHADPHHRAQRQRVLRKDVARKALRCGRAHREP
eukprot:790012-Rhodomonas_salina.1